MKKRKEKIKTVSWKEGVQWKWLIKGKLFSSLGRKKINTKSLCTDRELVIPQIIQFWIAAEFILRRYFVCTFAFFSATAKRTGMFCLIVTVFQHSRQVLEKEITREEWAYFLVFRKLSVTKGFCLHIIEYSSEFLQRI